MPNRRRTHWNYRITTRVIKGHMAYDLTNPKNNREFPGERVFSINEVYYRDGKPESYTDSKNILSDLDSVESLKWTRKKIKKAFKKPIIDLDNFPNEWESAE